MSLKHSFQIKRLVAFFLVLLLTSFAFLKLTATKSEAAWFDDTYAYRQQTTFTHNADITSDRRVTVTIDTTGLITNGKIQSTCADARFTDANGKLLRYQLTSACNLASTTFDVIFPTTNNGSNLAYFYYGNPSAPSGSTTVSDVTSLSPSGGAPATATETQGPSPISYWSLDEGQGNANDSTPQANTLTVTNAAWKPEEFCVSGKCLFFDGTGDYAAKTYSTDTELNPGTASFSVSLWFKHSSTTPSSNQFALARYITTGTPSGYKIYMNTSGNMCFGIDDDATWGPDDSACNSSNLADSQWHYLSAIKNTTSNIQLYIDGLLAKQTAVTATGSLSGTSPVFNVGIDTGQASGGWVGFLDEVKYYNFAKTAAGVQTEYSARSAPKGVSASFGPDTAKSLSSGLVGYWKMDEASGNATDSSGNGTTLTDASTTTYATGKYSNGADLESTSTDYLYAADNPTLSITSNLTLSGWIKPESNTASTEYIIVGKWDRGTVGQDRESYALAQFGDEIRVMLENGVTITTNSINLQTGSWYQVIGVYNATAQSVTIYLNGTLVTSTVTGTIPTSITDKSGTFHVGAKNNSTGSPTSYYDGIVDDIRVYNRALSPAEVAALYHWAPGPVGWWKMDEASWTADCSTASVADSSGNGNNAQSCPSGSGPSGGAVGKFGKGGAFDGVDDSISITDTTTTSQTGSMSISMWVKPSTLSGSQMLISKMGDIPQNSYYLDMVNSGKLRFWLTSTGGSTPDNYIDTDNVVLTTGTWAHISVVYSSTAQTVNFYVNGSSVPATLQGGSIPSSLFDSSRPTRIAVYENSSSVLVGYFTGNIDDVRVYNYVRTPKQIVEDMNAGHPTGGSPIGTQTLYYKFDEQNGSTINNSGYGSPTTATLTGAAWLLENNCKLNGCLNFANTTDNVAATDPSFFDGIATMSATFWINPQTLTASRAIMSKSNTNQETFRIESWSTNTELKVTISNSLTDTSNYYATQGLGLSTGWQHIAVVYDAGDLTNPVKVYRNGIKSGGGVAGTIPYGLTASTSDFRIGQSVGAVSALPAYIDEVKIYTGTALTESEIKIDANAGSAAALGGVLGTHNSEGFSMPNPIARWKMDENKDNTCTSGVNDICDSSPNGYNGPFTGNVSWRPGKQGSAIYLDGNSDYINFGDVDIPVFTTAYSVAFWMNVDTLSHIHNIYCASSDTDFCIYYLTSTDKLTFCGDGGTCTNTATSNAGVISANQWYRIVMTYDGTSAYNFWVNGINQTLDSTSGETANTTNSMYLGVDPTGIGSGDDFQGLIDDFTVYQSVLTPAQIAYDYNRGGPTHWYKFDECQGSTAYNAVVNANGAAAGMNGTITPGSLGNTSVGDCTTSGSTMWFNGATGKYNSALDFDGTDDYVLVTNPNLPTTNLTFATWIYLTADGSSDTILQAPNSAGSDEFKLIVDSSPTQIVRVQLDNTDVITSSQVIPDATWTHVAATRTGSTVTLYINGQQAGTGTNSATLIFSTCLLIGIDDGTACAGTYGGGFKGQIDDARIYNYGLTAAQIQRLYNEDSAVRFGPATGSP